MHDATLALDKSRHLLPLKAIQSQVSSPTATLPDPLSPLTK